MRGDLLVARPGPQPACRDRVRGCTVRAAPCVLLDEPWSPGFPARAPGRAGPDAD